MILCHVLQLVKEVLLRLPEPLKKQPICSLFLLLFSQSAASHTGSVQKPLPGLPAQNSFLQLQSNFFTIALVFLPPPPPPIKPDLFIFTLNPNLPVLFCCCMAASKTAALKHPFPNNDPSNLFAHSLRTYLIGMFACIACQMCPHLLCIGTEP